MKIFKNKIDDLENILNKNYHWSITSLRSNDELNVRVGVSLTIFTEGNRTETVQFDSLNDAYKFLNDKNRL